jgi:hypothetical protein
MLRKFCICLGVYYQLWLDVTVSDVEETDLEVDVEQAMGCNNDGFF